MYRKLLLTALSLALAACESARPSVIPQQYAACYGGAGVCIEQSILSVDQQALLEPASCAANELCAPRTLITGEVPRTCASFAGAEGRCMLIQLPMVAAQAERLPQSFCRSDERCVPCFDPFSALPTGACSLLGDPGPATSAVALATCCNGEGRCLDKRSVPPEALESLGTESCLDQQLCVPQTLIDMAPPKTCRSVAGAEGRCLSRCVPVVSEMGDALPLSSCLDTERCVPCFDPLTGVESGACQLPGDPGPSEPAYTFPSCCGSAGRCLPAGLVEPDRQSQLGPDSCAAEALCVPTFILEEKPARPCASIGNVEGRCLPGCLPIIQGQADTLPRSFCAEGELCAPCYDPFTSEPTGACALPADAGPVQPPMPFDGCCGGAALCVPEELVAPEQRASLTRDSCAGDRWCVPRFALDQTAPATCASLGDREGRCLPSCLPVVAAQEGRLPRSSCAETERCAPCFDPITGEATGACALAGDTGPTEPATAFATCCNAAALCLPAELVPAMQQMSVVQDSCEQGSVCVPRFAVDSRPPTSCASIGSFEGRCLPSCLPLVAERAGQLPRASCADNELCVPCFDPITGEATGACTLSGDPGPKAPAQTFPGCCMLAGESRGRCVPPEIVPEDKRSALMAETCQAEQLCVPSALLSPEAALPSCTSNLGTQGACAPTCILTSEQQSVMTRGTCEAWELCVPCQLAGTATGVCQ